MIHSLRGSANVREDGDDVPVVVHDGGPRCETTAAGCVSTVA
jgi:hypothetical protein